MELIPEKRLIEEMRVTPVICIESLPLEIAVVFEL